MPRFFLALAATVLAACATAPTPLATSMSSGASAAAAAQAALTPPAALTMTGVPPVPADMPERIGRYTEFKGAGLLDWSPDGKQVLVAFLRNNRTQLHAASGVGQPLRPLTRGDEPTRSGAYLPSDPGVVVFSRDVGGSEASRVYRLDLATGEETALTAAGRRCDAGAFDVPGTSVVVSCTSLDSAAAGNAERAARSVTSEILLVDVRGGSTRVVADLPGAGWFPGHITPDNRSLVVGRFRSISDSEVWMLDLASGVRHKLLPRDGEPPASYFVTGFTPDGKQMFIVSNRVGEFNQLYRYAPAAHRFEAVTAHIPWDVSGGDISRDRSRMAIITNENGLGALRVFDTGSLAPVPVAVPAGLSVTRVRLTDDGRRLAYTAQSARSPSEVRVADLPSPTIAADNVWAAADTAGMDTSTFQPIDVIEWKSFDGRIISGLIQRPPKKFGGKRPVLIEIHGGPEAQARLGFNGRYNYIVNEMGVALIQPNVRGSTGFGKTFHQLDNGKLREDSVRDIGALLDWIGQQPDLDPTRVVVQGGSYGGYMANAVAVNYPDRIRGAMPAVGISNFVSFLERTESYRRDLRRTEYGDERDPAMREFLTRISPLTNAHRIKVPLFVIHGRNDPRVPVQEAEQIAATVSRNGVPVWTMIAENEGHGFAKKENADYLFYARVLFLERFLLGN